jgi:histidinol phosphatase-like enzyme
MYREAAAADQLDLMHSAYIGDRWRDVQPALATGGIGILVPGIETPAADVEEARSALSGRIFMAENILEAVSVALAMIGARTPLQSPSVVQ